MRIIFIEAQYMHANACSSTWLSLCKKLEQLCCVRICIYVFKNARMLVCLYMSVCMFVYVCMYVYIYIDIYAHTYTYIYTCTYIHISVNIYVCIYIYIYHVSSKGYLALAPVRSRIVNRTLITPKPHFCNHVAEFLPLRRLAAIPIYGDMYEHKHIHIFVCESMVAYTYTRKLT